MKRSHISWRRASKLMALVFAGIITGSVATFYMLLGFNPPDISATRHISDVATHNVQSVALAEIPKHVLQSFLAIEDQRFYQHGGVDFRSVGRAALACVNGQHQGASTLTMQVARNVVLEDHSRTMRRKLRELFVALQLEHNYTKDQILESYLNEIYFGARAYGIQQASRAYFSKDTKDLSVDEGAMLAGLVKAPSQLSPFKSIENARERRNVVLSKMAELGYITDAQLKQLRDKPLVLTPGLRKSESAGLNGYQV
jgi:membrane peptidoglycan carboxypeptidase